MRNFMLNLTFLLFSFTVFAQGISLEKFYEKYDESTLSIDINLPNWLKDEIANMDHQGARSAIKKAKRFKLLIVDNQQEWKRDIKSLKRNLSANAFDELMTVRDEGELSLYLKDGLDVDGFRELIFFIDGDDEGVLLSLKGTFNQDDIEDIINDIHLECN